MLRALNDKIVGAPPPRRRPCADTWRIRRALNGDARFEICAEAADAALGDPGGAPGELDVCLLDLRMPGGGLATVWEIVCAAA